MPVPPRMDTENPGYMHCHRFCQTALPVIENFVVRFRVMVTG